MMMMMMMMVGGGGGGIRVGSADSALMRKPRWR